MSDFLIDPYLYGIIWIVVTITIMTILHKKGRHASMPIITIILGAILLVGFPASHLFYYAFIADDSPLPEYKWSEKGEQIQQELGKCIQFGGGCFIYDDTIPEGWECISACELIEYYPDDTWMLEDVCSKGGLSCGTDCQKRIGEFI